MDKSRRSAAWTYPEKKSRRKEYTADRAGLSASLAWVVPTHWGGSVSQNKPLQAVAQARRALVDGVIPTTGIGQLEVFGIRSL